MFVHACHDIADEDIQESEESVINMDDDDPDALEGVLIWLYTVHFDYFRTQLDKAKNSNDDEVKKELVGKLIKIQALSDKYGVQKLTAHISNNLESLISITQKHNHSIHLPLPVFLELLLPLYSNEVPQVTKDLRSTLVQKLEQFSWNDIEDSAMTKALMAVVTQKMSGQRFTFGACNQVKLKILLDYVSIILADSPELLATVLHACMTRMARLEARINQFERS